MFREMSWLPAAPADIRDQIKALGAAVSAGETDSAARLDRIATYRLDDSQLSKLGRIALSSPTASAHLAPLKIGLIGDGTLSLLAPPLAGSGVRHGLLLDVMVGHYNAAVQQVTNPKDPLHTSGLDMVFLALDRRIMGLDDPALAPGEAEARVEAALARVKLIVAALKPSVSGPVLVQSLPLPVEALFGSYDRVEGGSPISMTERFNQSLVEMARAGDIVLVDIGRLAATIGAEAWDDPRHWHASKLSFAPDLIPLFCDFVARTIATVKGRSKKALVLDLDNTLWGGVIGDDGVEGIVLGQGSSTGEAFLAIQRMALNLRERGIVLAVCSKNEEATARIPFAEHPEMLLKDQHIAVFQANWTDKATNLRAIAQALNIGVDALVFMDDNPFEREQVRSALPAVAVPEMPEDPAHYPRIIAAAGYFDTVTFTAEDRERATQYQANAERASMLASAGDLSSYLKSLDMVCTIGPVDRLTRPRVAQLINKSNQFNLTTRRYTEQQLAAMESDPRLHLVQVRLADRLGDNGIISVLIARDNGDTWDIDTWLMSCRVLGRDVEQAVLSHLVEAARRAGAKWLVGEYLPTKKNVIVVDHYAKLGFEPAGAAGDGGTRWQLPVENYRAPDLPMNIIDSVLSVSREKAA